MAQKYGMELECFGLTPDEVASAIRSVEGLDYGGHFGYHGSRRLGLRCDENGNGNLWVSEDDSSLRNTAGRGICHEVISPVLEGEAGLRTAGKVMTALSRAGAKVNKSCGLHTTFGIENSSARFRRMSAKKQAQCIVNIGEAYDYFMQGFDSLVSPSRRYHHPTRSSYASPVSLWGGNQFCQPRADPQAVVRYGFNRGYLNIGSFVSKGIIEFRQHNGTLNRWKIYNWSLLLQRLVQWALNDRHTNHGCDLREFPPTLDGLMDMVAVGSDLRRALTERAEELASGMTSGQNYYDERMEAYEAYHLSTIVASAGSIDASLNPSAPFGGDE